ncbi:hypothetical protein [Legionella micdadei]|nr:hypothetical protein [Legionella micdadei]ARG97153.1 hypothetical protein B6N58_05470 [Legionella micdadei]
MPYIINLSTIHAYSIDETVSAFAKICNKYSRGCLQCTPHFFRNGTNYLWVMAQYKWHYKSLIEPYKLGRISTEQFLDNLAQIFYFLNGMDIDRRNNLLREAWNASIQMNEMTRERFVQVMEMAKTEPVYLISNTNELNIQAVLDCFRQNFPELSFNERIDTNIKDDKNPVEILPNVFLCLSYRYKAFKTEYPTTGNLLEELIQHTGRHVTVVSQYENDLKKASELGVTETHKAQDFFGRYYSMEATPLI